MKTRNSLVLLSLMMILALSGCQRSASTTDNSAVGTEAVSSAAAPAQRTVRVRNPETGRIETRPVPAKADLAEATATGEDVPAAPVHYTTQRMRMRQTGAEETRQVPVNAAPAEATATVEEDAPAASSARYTTHRVRNPQTGAIETKRVPVTDRYQLSWPIDCSVQTAYAPVLSLIYTQLGLDKLDNPQGEGQLQPAVDYMSAVLKARSAVGVVFEVTLLADTPDTCMVTVAASSKTQPEEFLKTHTQFLKEQINQTLSQPSDDSSPALYPKTMVVDQPIHVVAGKISAWGKQQGFRGSPSGSDQYYKHLSYSSSSNIEFGFSMRLIDTNKTKLDIGISSYHGKDEFPMILKSLQETLDQLDEAAAAAGEASETVN